ncbi:MAG: hypothetical protein ACOCUI_05735 [bacterium]
MSENMSLQDFHKNQAINLFNHTWDIIDKKDRTKEESLEMIHSSHTSLYHWFKIGDDSNLFIGEWLISRVYCEANMPESAIYHSKISKEICDKNDFKGFNLAYSYEGLARAYALSGDKDKALNYKKLAEEEAENIDVEENRKALLSDLESINI